MKLIQVGTIGRPHSFRGEFVLSHGAVSPSLRDHVRTLYIGPNEKSAAAHAVQGYVPMPKGLRIKLETFNSDTDVKAKRGTPVFVDRQDLPAPSENEFYVGDLIGSEVREKVTERRVGVLTGVEEVGHGSPDRWWVRNGPNEYAFPATSAVILEVDAAQRVIWIKDGSQFQQFHQ